MVDCGSPYARDFVDVSVNRAGNKWTATLTPPECASADGASRRELGTRGLMASMPNGPCRAATTSFKVWPMNATRQLVQPRILDWAGSVSRWLNLPAHRDANLLHFLGTILTLVPRDVQLACQPACTLGPVPFTPPFSLLRHNERFVMPDK